MCSVQIPSNSSLLTLYSLAWTTWTCIFLHRMSQFNWLDRWWPLKLTLVTRHSSKSASTSGRYFMSKNRHPPTWNQKYYHHWENSCGLSSVHLWSEKYMFRDHMFRIKCASYLEFCIHSTGWMDILQICIAPIQDPLPLWPLQDFTSFTISANLRGTYIAAGSSKSKCQTFFAFLPKQVTFWRQSQTWSWELSLF